jgi:hypothetical protein
LWEAADNPKLAQQTRAEVFEKLKLGLPEKLRDSYSSSKEYHSSFQKLVVEETLFSILAALKVFQSKTPQQLQKDCIRVHVTGDRNENPWFEAYSYQPISGWNRKNLRAGSVIVMVPAGHEYTEANVVFGVIKHGSEKSPTCKLLILISRCLLPCLMRVLVCYGSASKYANNGK